MSNYRRLYRPGGSYFFTVVTYCRRPLFSEPANIDLLRSAFRHVKAGRPFELPAIVILPNHLHTLWCLPDGDHDFSTRWQLIKRYVAEQIATSTNRRGEKEVWQRRFWEHAIRDEEDWERHMDYIHYNPVKHGYATSPLD